MIPEDFTDILLQHKTRELEAVERSNRVLFEDTDCLTTLFYIGFLEGRGKGEKCRPGPGHRRAEPL